MENVSNFLSVVAKSANKTSVGAAGVTYYDPHMPRTWETIKSAVAKGHPVLVRLHAGAQYPVGDDSKLPRDQIDLEGHAVLVVGYNDDAAEVAVIDPSCGAVRWMPYSIMNVAIVDCSLGAVYVAPPPIVSYDVQSDEEGRCTIALTVGFEQLPGRVMDRENLHISGVHASVTLASGEVIEAKVTGRWRVGEAASLSMQLPAEFSDLPLSVATTVAALRPYAFSDVLTTKLTVRRRGEHLRVPAQLAA